MNTKDTKSRCSNLIIFHDIEGKTDIRRYETVIFSYQKHMLADVNMSSLARFSCLDRQQGSFTAKQILCLPGQRFKKKKKPNKNPNQKTKPPSNTKPPLLELCQVLKAAKGPLCHALFQTLCAHTVWPWKELQVLPEQDMFQC